MFNNYAHHNCNDGIGRRQEVRPDAPIKLVRLLAPSTPPYHRLNGCSFEVVYRMKMFILNRIITITIMMIFDSIHTQLTQPKYDFHNLSLASCRPTTTSLDHQSHCLLPKWLTKPPPCVSTLALSITFKHISTLSPGLIGPVK